MSFIKKMACGLKRRRKSKRTSTIIESGDRCQTSPNVQSEIVEHTGLSHINSLSAMESDVGTSAMNSHPTHIDSASSNPSRDETSELVNSEIDTTDTVTDVEEELTTDIDVATFQEEIKSIKPITEEDIWSFIGDPRSFDLPTIYKVQESLRHHNFANLYRKHGHNKSIVIFAIIYNCLTGITPIDDGILLSTYMNLNERRLVDITFYSLFESQSSQILSMKKALNQILKDKTRNSFICVECEKNTVSILFLPCGHIILCDNCHSGKDEVCRSCASTILESHHVFF